MAKSLTKKAAKTIFVSLANEIAEARIEGEINREYHITVYFSGSHESIVAKGFNLIAPGGGGAEGWFTADQIEALAELDQVLSIEREYEEGPLLDNSISDISVPSAWNIAPVHPSNTARGKGAIVGIIDSGIDVFHGAFRNADGTTRIQHLWDQTFKYNVNGKPIDYKQNELTGDDVPKDETDKALVSSDGRFPFPASSPSPFFNWGVEFDFKQINAALLAHPDGKDLPISLLDDGSKHGTHVAGIAAGNGSDPDRCTDSGTYVGVAPEADLIIVKMGFGITQYKSVILAVEYIFKKADALGLPCVINLSLGGHFRFHNGLDRRDRMLDQFVKAKSGRAIVAAAGNERRDDIHIATVLGASTNEAIKFSVADGVKRIIFSGSVNPTAALEIEFTIPKGSAPDVKTGALLITGNQGTTFGGHNFDWGQRPSYPGDASASVSNPTGHPADPDVHFTFEIYIAAGDDVESGNWTINMINGAGTNAFVHLWVAVPSSNERKVTFEVPAGAQTATQDETRPSSRPRRPEDWIRGTIASPAVARDVIAVGAYQIPDPGEGANAIADFSSQGPKIENLSAGLYGERGKPEVCAPGVGIKAPMAEARRCFLQCECCVGRYHYMDGTSQASPHVAGVVALMLVQHPTMRIEEIRATLKATALVPLAGLPDGWPEISELFGFGMINARDCVIAAHVSAGGGPISPSGSLSFTALPPLDPLLGRPHFDFPDLLSDWEKLFGKRPAWQLFAALISQHFDEVKRLIDTNRRVGAIWQRSGGPDIIHCLIFGERQFDPFLPENVDGKPVRGLIDRLFKILNRFGSQKLQDDIDRYGGFVLEFPGKSLEDIDAIVLRVNQ